MFTVRDHRTGDLFDPWAHLGEKRRKLLEQSWAGVFREHLLNCLPVGELSRQFDRTMGRPTKDLHMALGVLILQQLHDLTDAQAIEALAFNLQWHYALDIRDDSDTYLCERTLRNYRRLLIDQELDAVLFRGLTDRLIERFGVDTSKQRLDSTALRSAMRILTRLGVVVEVISKFIRELARTHPDLHTKIDPDVIRPYVDREGEGCFASTTPSESRRRLPEAGKDLLALALMFRKTEATTLHSFELLERVLREHFEVTDGDEPQQPTVIVKDPKDVPCDGVNNPSDPDSSYNHHRGQGFLAQVMETYQEDDGNDDESDVPDLITHVSVGQINGHDGHHLEPALDDVERRNAKPKQLLADSHYGGNEQMELAEQRKIDLVTPSMPPKGYKQGKLTLEDFELDEQGGIVRCPAGHEPESTSISAIRIQAKFDQSICNACPLKERCPTQTCKGPRYQYNHERVARRARRLRDRQPAFRKRYRWRAGVEATMSRLKYQMGMSQLRVRGLSAMRYVTHLRALCLNILRCAFIPQSA